jgi:hypothetical protein
MKRRGRREEEGLKSYEGAVCIFLDSFNVLHDPELSYVLCHRHIS